MRTRWVGILTFAAAIALTASAPRAARAGADREGGTLLARDGEERLISWSEAGTALRRQPAPVEPAAKPLLRRQRPNTVSVGFQGQYGVLRGNSRLADGFDHGPGYAFRFRYMVSPSAALGFSFENQHYGSINAPTHEPQSFADSHVVATTVAVEGVFYIHREREVNPYFIGGFGYASPDVVFTGFTATASAPQEEGDQSSRVNEGPFLTAGIGLERFIRERFSMDVAVRGYTLISNSEFTAIGQVSLGIHLYPGD
jgi:hypothetical protein